MRETVKDLAKNTVISIGIAMVLFCLFGIGFDIGYKGDFNLENYQFTKMVIGCALIGMGFGVPTVVYKKDNLPMPIRVVIHMGIGLTVYTVVAFAVGWFGKDISIAQGIGAAALIIILSFIIWYFFMRYYKAEAKKMNDRIQAMK